MKMITPKLTYSTKWALENREEFNQLLGTKLGIKVDGSYSPIFFYVFVDCGDYNQISWFETGGEAIAYAKELKANGAENEITVYSMSSRVYKERKKPAIWLPSYHFDLRFVIAYFPNQADVDGEQAAYDLEAAG